MIPLIIKEHVDFLEAEFGFKELSDKVGSS